LEINSYKDLRIWQQSMDLAVDSYRASAGFPKSELYGLISQINRSASSVPANIAEGHGRETTGSFIQFLRIAQGSLKELETHIILSTRLEMMDKEKAEQLLLKADEIGRMLRSMIRKLQDKAT
jgi:four helix bundle protein